jgi:2TM domain
MNDLTTPARYDLQRRARRRVNMRIAWQTHALIFVLVNLGLAAINLYNGGPRWFLAPLSGWGLGLAIHGIVTLIALRGDSWRDRLVAQEAERLRRQR